MKAFYKTKLLIISFKELKNKDSKIILPIYIGLINTIDFFINRELKLSLKLLIRLIIKTFLYNFKKLVVSYKRDIFKIILLL